MKKPGFFFLAAIGLLSLTFIVSSSWAQSGKRLHYSTLFNPGTVGTVSGEVVRVEQTSAGNGADYCVHALLKTPQGQMTAILAPRGYMAKQGLTIAPKDRVTVTGSLDLDPQKALHPGHGGDRRPHHETQGSQRPSGLGGGGGLARAFPRKENNSAVTPIDKRR